MSSSLACPFHWSCQAGSKVRIARYRLELQSTSLCSSYALSLHRPCRPSWLAWAGRTRAGRRYSSCHIVISERYRVVHNIRTCDRKTGKHNTEDLVATAQDFFISVIETAPWLTLLRSQAPYTGHGILVTAKTQTEPYLGGNKYELPVLVSQAKI